MTMQDLAEREELRLAVADLSSRAETALSEWGAQLRHRTKPVADATPNTAADRVVAEEKLRQQLAELESETAFVQREYDAKVATASFWERRKMIAMRHSDDVAVQEALQGQSRHAEAVQELVGELAILRALALSCREVLAGHDETV
jgi:hypothetical protein